MIRTHKHVSPTIKTSQTTPEYNWPEALNHYLPYVTLPSVLPDLNNFEKEATLADVTIDTKFTSRFGLNEKVSKGCEGSALVSIIIVTLNAERYLQRCLDSILKQEYPALEIIVVDGASTDNTIAIIKSNAEHIKYWSSEKDEGIYYAMNKAILKTQGQWTYFLGSDDELTPEFSELAYELKDSRTIYYGSVWKNSKKYLGKLSAYTHAKMGVNHQAMIYPSSVFKKYKFDTNFRISADHILNMWCWKDKDYKYMFKDYTIATFNTTGISSLNKDQLFEKHKANLIFKNYGIIIGLRFIFKKLKESLKKL